MGKRSVLKNYGFLGVMLLSMFLGCVLGWIAPGAAVAVKPLGTVFINIDCSAVAVPLVFASVAGSVDEHGEYASGGTDLGHHRDSVRGDRDHCGDYYVCTDEGGAAGAGAVAGDPGRGDGRICFAA